MHQSNNLSALESRARRAIKRHGYSAHKSRWRAGTVDNRGGFQIRDPQRGAILWGEKFDLSADDVLALAAELQ